MFTDFEIIQIQLTDNITVSGGLHSSSVSAFIKMLINVLTETNRFIFRWMITKQSCENLVFLYLPLVRVLVHVTKLIGKVLPVIHTILMYFC